MAALATTRPAAGVASLRPVRSTSRQPLARRSWLRPSAAAATDAAAPEGVDQLEVLLLRLEEGWHQLGGYIQRLEVGQQQLGQRMQHLEAGQQQLEDGLQRVRQAEERLRGLISRGPLARANKGEEEAPVSDPAPVPKKRGRKAGPPKEKRAIKQA